jgi:hypothetical protein
LQFEDQQGTVLYRTESYLVQTDRWRPGEVMLHRMAVRAPPGTPPGLYSVRLTWVYHDSGVYVPFVDESGAMSAVWAEIGHVQVQRPAVFPDASVLKVDHPARSLYRRVSAFWDGIRSPPRSGPGRPSD